MKAANVLTLKILIGVAVFHILLGVVIYFVLLPALTPNDLNVPRRVLGELRFNYVIAGGLASLAATIAVVLAIRYLSGGSGHEELVNAIRMPAVVVGGDGRYAIINKEAERALGLSGERDIGKPLDPMVTTALTAARSTPGELTASTVIERLGVKYQVLDNPLPIVGGDARGQARLVLLQDVTHQMRIHDAVRDIGKSTALLNANTNKISNSSMSLSQGATEQASSLSAISSSLDEFSKKIQGNTESAAKGTQLAAQAREAAERSGKEIAHALSAMTDVQDAGIRIARIVKLIDDIAFQTNLLALNAAVEAARAGRQGKGFAVVADEVRNLAGRSAKAAKDTASMVEDVTERIGNASNYISKLEEMLRNIVQDTIRMADSSEYASATSSEQASAILQVNHELNQMRSVTQTTMSDAEQTATAVEALARQVSSLKEKLDSLVKGFSLAGGSGFKDGQPDDMPSRPAINLLDDPVSYLPPSRGHSYFTGNEYPERQTVVMPNDNDFGGLPGMTGNIKPEKWDLDIGASDSDENLSDLLRSDGYDEFLSTATHKQRSFRPDGGMDDFPVDFKTNAEGDRVVKPGQNIQLDDAEFGRY